MLIQLHLGLAPLLYRVTTDRWKFLGMTRNKVRRHLRRSVVFLYLTICKTDDDLNTLSFPLHLQGVMSYLPVRKPTAAEWETGDIIRIDMTAENLDWDPNDSTYSSQEAAMTDYREVVLPCPDRVQPFVINAVSSMTTDAADITNDENFGIALEQHVTVSVAALDTTKTAPGQIHSNASKPVDAETLAKRWLIPANHATRTVNRTTQ
jgi:hypothetical protein